MSDYLPFEPSKTKMDTQNDYGNAISNVGQLIEEYRTFLELKDKVYLYDNLRIMQTPAIAIAFDTGKITSMSLGGKCNLNSTGLNIFYYLETLNPGSDTYPHLCRVYNLVRVLYDNNSLYNICHSEPMSVDSIDLVGRRLESNVYLTGHIVITVNARFC